jgi:phage gpG-like protein
MAGTVVLDDREWQQFFRSVGGKLADPRPILRVAFATRGFSDIIRHFEKESGPDGVWVKSKRAERDGGKTLQDTGNLRRNFLPTNLEDVGKQAIRFFNPTPYAAAHDDPRPGSRNPQREFMWLSDRAQEDMINIILDQLVQS